MANQQRTPGSTLYITVYDRELAHMGGAAWVDSRIRRGADHADVVVKDFLVSDQRTQGVVELELRGKRFMQLKTLARMIFLREPYIVAKFRQSYNWRRRTKELQAAWRGQYVVTSQWPSLLLAADAGIPVDTHIAHNADYRLSELYDPLPFRILKNARRTQRYEIGLSRRARRVVALSAVDAELLSGQGGRRSTALAGSRACSQATDCPRAPRSGSSQGLLAAEPRRPRITST